MTVKELADRVVMARKTAWDKSDPKTAIVATRQLGPEDEAAVRRIVAAAGCKGSELEDMTRQVSARVVELVEALADNMPAAGAD